MVAIFDNVWSLISSPFKSSGDQGSLVGTSFLLLVIILLCVVTPVIGMITSAVATHTFVINPSVNPSAAQVIGPSLLAANAHAYSGGLNGFSGARHMDNRASGLMSTGSRAVSPGAIMGLATQGAGL